MEGERRLATGIPARLSPAEGRKFGLTVGVAFLVIAARALVAGPRTGAVPYVGGLGTVLVLAGLAHSDLARAGQPRMDGTRPPDLEGDDARSSWGSCTSWS